MEDTSAADATLTLPAIGSDGQARLTAMREMAGLEATPTSLVGYASQGRVAVIGPFADASAAIAQLTSSGLAITALITDGEADGASPAGDALGVRAIHARPASVRGHLGAFEIDVHAEGELRTLAPSILTGNQPFDLVLDLGPRALLEAELPPPGYYAPCGDAGRLAAALAELPDMIGEFEKPRYFEYDPSICAHGARGQRGCTRCIDACPTSAIASVGERIEVDPHLCQGAGSCATACPTGAITYASPRPADLIDRLRTLIGGYRRAGGSSAVVLLHDGEAGREWLATNAARLDERVLPFVLEEAGSAGIEAWLSALAFGVVAVRVLAPVTLAASVRRELGEQMETANAVLDALGFGCDRIALASDEAELELDATLAPIAGPPAAFAGVDDKRAQLRLAIDHLAAQASDPPSVVPLPSQAPFGRIEVDSAACTLCLGCVSVCPAGAVLAGGDRPQLAFVEQNCVQCGMCASACPEHAIALESRLMLDREARAERRVLMEDAPFHCVSCGKVFGTTRTIERMLERLAGHWMFQDKPEQMQRLKMCEDCRVKDMFRDGGGLLDPHDDG